MGASHGVFTEEHLQKLEEEHGHMTVSEIKHAYKRFSQLCEDKKNALDSSITKETFSKIPELIVNPFTDRIWAVFSNKGEEFMDFEHFLTMVAVFNLSAPIDIKAESAFRVYDFDGDEELSRGDVMKILIRQTSYYDQNDRNMLHRMDDDSISEIVNQMFSDLELSNDENITQNDFVHILSNAPDFYSTFCVTF